MKSVHIGSYSGPDFPVFGLNTERYGVSLRIQSKCGKLGTRITLNTDIIQILYGYCTGIIQNYTVWNQLFLIKIHIKNLTKVFYIQIWFKCHTLLLFFLMKAMVYRKKIIYRKNSFLAVGYLAVTELHIVHTWRNMQSE